MSCTCEFYSEFWTKQRYIPKRENGHVEGCQEFWVAVAKKDTACENCGDRRDTRDGIDNEGRRYVAILECKNGCDKTWTTDDIRRMMRT